MIERNKGAVAPPCWLNPLLGATVQHVYQVCLDLDGVLEDVSLAMLETSTGVFQVSGEVHSVERVVRLRPVDGVRAPATVVDYAPHALRTRLVDAVGDPFEVAEIHYLQAGPSPEYLDAGAFLLDSHGKVRLVVWAFLDDVFVDRPERMWMQMHKWIRFVGEARVMRVQAAGSDLAG